MPLPVFSTGTVLKTNKQFLKVISMKSAAFAFLSLMILIGCNSGTADKKEDSIKTDSLTQTVSDVKKVTEPAIGATTPEPKCFQNDGQKYRTIINLFYFSPTDVSGTIAVDEYGKKLVDKQRFMGMVNGNEITVKFQLKPPVIGEASEWTTKPWTIKSTLGAETLSIIFNARNYETNQWAETTYEFKACTGKIK
jgi:hypothetical protein